MATSTNTNNANLFDGLKKLFLAGVGAVAIAGEKTGEVVSSLAERGESVVSQGRDLNHELSRKASNATRDTRDSLLKTRIELMSDEERQDFVASVQRVSAQVSEERAAKQASHAKTQNLDFEREGSNHSEEGSNQAVEPDRIEQ